MSFAAQAVLAPQITSALTTTIGVGQTYSYQITASNSPTGYTATGLPEGLPSLLAPV